MVYEKQKDNMGKLSFEEAIKQLTNIVGKIEQGQIGLQDSLEQYEKGMTLIKHCRGILDKAEKRGRHKERKWWVELRQEEIHWVPVRHYYGRCSIEPKLPFDAEKVKALILELVSTTFDLGTTTYAKLTPEERAEHYVVLSCRQAALHSLYKELGIE